MERSRDGDGIAQTFERHKNDESETGKRGLRVVRDSSFLNLGGVAP